MAASTPTPDPDRARPVAAALRLLLPLLLVLLLLAACAAALVGGAAWLLRSEGGTQWLLARVPGLQVSAPRGALLGPDFSVDRLELRWGDSAAPATLVLTGLRAESVQPSWRPAAGAWFGLDIARLQVQTVQYSAGAAAAPGPAPTLPSTLKLPLQVRIGAVQVQTLSVDTLAPVQGLAATGVEAGPERYAVGSLALRWDRLQVQARAQLAAAAPYALDASAQLAPAEGDAFAVTLRADGTLERVDVSATLRGPASAGKPAPSADLQAQLMPFAAWPLGELSARTQALDLSTLSSAAPQTRLDGEVQVSSSALDAPIDARVAIENTLPGRWDEGRLPVRRLGLQVSGQASQRERVEIRSFDLQFADARRAAGRWQGSGSWTAAGLQLSSTLRDVQPQSLDGRAAAMTLSGPVELLVDGLPAPSGEAASGPPGVTLRSTLEGRLDGAPYPVQLTLDASANADRVELRTLRARADRALAEGSATAQRDARGHWGVKSEGRLLDFEPLPWWPGSAGSAWRQGPHRLSADWAIDLRVPANAAALALPALLQQLGGSGTLRVHDSVLAGVPVALDLALAQDPSDPSTPSSVRGELRLAGNRLTVEGRADPAGDGAQDRLQAELDAGTLSALAPLVRLLPAAAAYAPRGGSASARLQASGRWPQISTEGEATLSALQAGELRIDAGSLNWNLDMRGAGSDPLTLQAELTGMRLGARRAEALRAELRGTIAEHRLTVTGALPLNPTPQVERWLGLQRMAGTRAQLQAAGRWRRDADGTGVWVGGVERLAVGPWDGTALAALAEPPAQWADARDLRAELRFDAGGQLQQVQAAAGRLRVADAIALRWDDVRVDLRGAQPTIDVQAEVETFELAPLLARLEPQMGWAGDLRIGATLKLRAAERFDADLVLRRIDGDMFLSDGSSTQMLGLSDAQLTLSAHDGQWRVTQSLAGRTLGEMRGALNISTTADRRWPGPDAPIQGELTARVANLGIWANWVPAGWRLGGELTTRVAIGGRFGAPEYTGELLGSGLAVRNLLLGVNVRDGEVAVRLDGSTAQIEKFTFQGGDGRLVITGGAQFGATPTAALKIEADHFRVLGRIDRQLIASGSAALTLSREAMRLDGRFGIDEGLFDIGSSDAPSLDDDVTVRRASDPEPEGPANGEAQAQRTLSVAIDIDLGEKLRVRGRGLDTLLRGQLRVSTPGGRLAVTGTVSTYGGTYAAYGQKLAIERGNISFSGAIDNPRLDILALRPDTDDRIGVSIGGTVVSPRVRLYAETDMSETDKLSWLVLGREPDGLGRTDTALLQRAAVALLAGEGEAPSDTFIKNLGLDELSLRQSDGEVRETVISLGKQLSRRWYVGYERGVNATTGTWQLIYRIAQRFTLRAQSGLDNSIDVIWTWRVDEVSMLPPLRGPAPAAPAAPASAASAGETRVRKSAASPP